MFFILLILLPPRSTRTDTLFPYTTLFLSQAHGHAGALLVIAFVEPDGCADCARGKGVFVDFRKLCARREPVRHDRDDPSPLPEARYGSAQVTHRCELVCSSSH